MNSELLSRCHQKIKPYIHNTPVLSSQLIDELAGASLFFKCENFQKMGAFKMRGAVHALSQLTADQKNKGVITHSSGNFAQAVSLAAKNLGMDAHIVMPLNAPKVKREAVAGYGGKITLCEPTLTAREKTTQELIDQLGLTFVHPSNDLNVILGNATAAMELLQEQPDLDYLFAPVGGGGLIAGTALAAHFFGQECKTVGGEPSRADDAFRSLQSGKIETNETADTIADGLKTHLGDINFPIIQDHVETIITVTDTEIIEAMRLLWERMKLVVEPSSAVALAALLKEKHRFDNKKCGLILSGGNVDLAQLPF